MINNLFIVIFIVLLIILYNEHNESNKNIFYYSPAKLIKEGFSNLSKNLFNFSKHNFDIPYQYTENNTTPYTHLPTQWAVCKSDIETINNNIISDLITKQTDPFKTKPYNICSLNN